MLLCLLIYFFIFWVSAHYNCRCFKSQHPLHLHYWAGISFETKFSINYESQIFFVMISSSFFITLLLLFCGCAHTCICMHASDLHLHMCMLGFSLWSQCAWSRSGLASGISSHNMHRGQITPKRKGEMNRLLRVQYESWYSCLVEIRSFLGNQASMKCAQLMFCLDK